MWSLYNLINQLHHSMNPLHVYCRMVDFCCLCHIHVKTKVLLTLSNKYERLLYGGMDKLLSFIYNFINRRKNHGN